MTNWGSFAFADGLCSRQVRSLEFLHDPLAVRSLKPVSVSFTHQNLLRRGRGKAAPILWMRRCFWSPDHQAAELAGRRLNLNRSSLPFLMLPPFDREISDSSSSESSDDDDDDDHYYNFFSLADEKEMRIKMDLGMMPWQRDILSPEEAICVGSSHGWLAFIHPRNCSLYLFSPFIDPSSSSYFPYLPLPPIETLPSVISSIRYKSISSSSMVMEYVCDCYDEMDPYVSTVPSVVSPEELSEYFIKKLVLSSAPSPILLPSSLAGIHNPESESDCTVMALQGYEDSWQLAFCKPGDTSWTSLDGNAMGLEDMIYFSKDQLFYTLCVSGRLKAWDLRRNPPKSSTVMKSSNIDIRQRTAGKHSYLAESSGDLLMVVRYFDYYNGPDDEYSLETSKFHVYKLDFIGNKWVNVASLGDRVLFVGSNHSVSLSALDFPGLIQNSIYFARVDNNIHMLDPDPWRHDFGVFNLEDNTVSHFDHFDLNKIQHSPVWVIPNL